MKRFASFLLIVSLLAVFVLPIVEPTYSAFAQPDGSAVSDGDGDEPVELPTEEPTETDTPVPPPTDTPVPPATDTPAPLPTEEPPASATQEPSATDIPVQPAAASSTPVKDFQTGDLVAATARLNCREVASSGAVLSILEKNQQVFVVESAQPVGGYNWVQVQLQDDATTRCFAADQYLDLIQANAGVPPTASATAAATATPYKNLKFGDLAVASTNINCRVSGSPTAQILLVVKQGQKIYIISSPQSNGGFDWSLVQLQDAGRTQCYLAAQFVALESGGASIPSTFTPTPVPTRTSTATPIATDTATSTATKTATETETPTVTNTPTETATLTGSETPTATSTATSTATETATSSATPTKTATASVTPYKNLKFGDVVAANARVNCRISGSPTAKILLVIEKDQQVYVISSPQSNGDFDWSLVQLQDAGRTQCYLAAQFVDYVSSGTSIPPTFTPTTAPSNTPTKTPTLTGSETATPTPSETLTPTITNTATQTLTPTVTLTPTETLTPTQTLTPSQTPIATSTLTPTIRNLHAGDIVKVNATANCRASASTESAITGVISKNEMAVLLTDPVNTSGYDWSKIRPYGTHSECYFALQFVDLVQAGGGFTPTPAASGSATAEAAGPYKVGDTIETTASVNMRTDAGTNFPVVKTIAAKTQGSVLPGFKQANGLDWIHVQFPTGSGWIAAQYSKLVSSGGSQTSGPYAIGTELVVSSIVNLRVLPGTSSTSLGLLQPGQRGLALGAATKAEGRTWIQVEFSIGSGWVAGDFLKKLSAVTPTPQPVVSKVWVYLDCTSNPQRIIVENNNLSSIKIISIGSLYNPTAAEPYTVNMTAASKVTFSFLAGSNASGTFALTKQKMLNDKVGSQEGVIVKTSLGDKTARCPAVTSGEKWIEINLTTQTLYAYRGSTVISSSLVSTGKPGFETPPGTFYTYYKTPLTDMAACIKGECYDTKNVPWNMLFLQGGYFIHGAYWHRDFGKVRSHGCVNLPVPYAEWLYYWAPLNTRVWIHY